MLANALGFALVWTIYSHVHDDYKAIIEDEKSGLVAWRKLKARFEKSTMSRPSQSAFGLLPRVRTFTALSTILPFPLTSSLTRSKRLGKFSRVSVANPVISRPLMSSLSTFIFPGQAFVSITSNKDEQKFDDVVGILNGSTVDPPVKQESDDEGPAVAMGRDDIEIRFGWRKGNGGFQ
ncbi:hypothetical protein B0H14DRAFT_3508327 [Mycena olivaceomarginata]|nr:hypothetical protein B0H14DRAFT_3508327 [Mycena olivaceomarginata]